MITTTNLTMQFGGKPLFENVSIRFGHGNRYGLIGANGCGKSTFMKILGGDLEPSAGSVAIDKGERLGKLRQDQFAYEDMRVLDVVLMGHAEMWQAMQERDAIYANSDASEDDYMRAAELEHEFAEFGGYTAEARASSLLTGIGVPIAQHDGPMSAVAPGWKLRVLLAQALFGLRGFRARLNFDHGRGDPRVGTFGRRVRPLRRIRLLRVVAHLVVPPSVLPLIRSSPGSGARGPAVPRPSGS